MSGCKSRYSSKLLNGLYSLVSSAKIATTESVDNEEIDRYTAGIERVQALCPVEH